MAIAYMEMKIISRGNATQSRNCVASAAYDSREKMYSTDNGHTYNYSRKIDDVENKNVLLPEHAPAIYKDRQTLWQAVEQVEKSSKAQLARKIILALPCDVTPEERQQIVENFCQTAFVSQGMCVDYSIHKPDKGNNNYHAHIMLTMRSIDENGQWLAKKKRVAVLDKDGNKIEIKDKKNRTDRNKYVTKTVKTNDWDNQENLEKWRNLAEQEINKFLPEEKHISMKSYARQGLDQVGQVHEGYSYNPERKALNEKIKKYNQYNKELDKISENIKTAKIQIEKEKITEIEEKRLSKTAVEARKLEAVIDNTLEKEAISAKAEFKALEEKQKLQQQEKEKLQQEIIRQEKKLQIIKNEAKEAGEKKHFWQNKNDVAKEYFEQHHGYGLQNDIRRNKDNLKLMEANSVSPDQIEQAKQKQRIAEAAAAMDKDGLQGFYEYCRKNDVPYSLREDIQESAQKKLSPERQDAINTERLREQKNSLERDKEWQGIEKSYNESWKVKRQQQQVGEELRAKLKALEEEKNKSKPKAKLAPSKHREKERAKEQQMVRTMQPPGR